MQISRSVLKQLKKIAGEKNVLTDALSLSLYSYDCSLSRTKPDVVILVAEEKTLPVLIQFLVKPHIPFTPRAAATNHAGGCATLYGGAVLDLTRLNRILTINTQEKFADVQPGVITADLQDQASRLGLLYAPDIPHRGSHTSKTQHPRAGLDWLFMRKRRHAGAVFPTAPETN